MTITARAPIETKRCCRCGETKAVTEFNRRRRSCDGLQHNCKPCSNAVYRAWAQAHPERHQANIKRSNEEWTARRRAKTVTARAKWAAIAQEAARP